eukprot:6919497-Prymnesium_polylepis.1
MYAAARCACVSARFGGSACGGCAPGWQGAACEERRPREVRRDMAGMPAHERDAFFGLVRAAGATDEFKAMEAAHEFGLANYHETSHLLLSHHAYFAQALWPPQPSPLIEVAPSHYPRFAQT